MRRSGTPCVVFEIALNAYHGSTLWFALYWAGTYVPPSEYVTLKRAYANEAGSSSLLELSVLAQLDPID